MHVRCYCGQYTLDGIVGLCFYHMVYRRIDGSPMAPREAGQARLQSKPEFEAELKHVEAKITKRRASQRAERRRRHYAA